MSDLGKQSAARRSSLRPSSTVLSEFLTVLTGDKKITVSFQCVALLASKLLNTSRDRSHLRGFKNVGKSICECGTWRTALRCGARCADSCHVAGVARAERHDRLDQPAW